MDKESKKQIIDFYDLLLNKQKKSSKNDLNKFSGSLKILEKDPLEFQKEIRNEWK
ncbi:hypothetical protein PQQ32_05105 [Brachyspira hyodysenteriae]|uniref:hypothetical protein n=1 Tax=Brachyspira hyodysenteriae TaxID=159 RepID=UPI0022CD4C80|nr:hypothetical protein [Brachyspira hyodysenteriae]MCZ9891730.1 hypothetical protein [Brachyspira hyodysenteriae]MCZ9967035.1 hypothetical protein [Brachyspira hyodysenteriae]MCZ9989282.1 hypothetical protein [Brachyspira hyodysenteriae]MCZ9991038.1 hypothetical protein [Brachyspira hyodysenteriae]MCZ9997643.1 hypothetical protein [Brachyspira hyodysenteriae]